MGLHLSFLQLLSALGRVISISLSATQTFLYHMDRCLPVKHDGFGHAAFSPSFLAQQPPDTGQEKPWMDFSSLKAGGKRARSHSCSNNPMCPLSSSIWIPMNVSTCILEIETYAWKDEYVSYWLWNREQRKNSKCTIKKVKKVLICFCVGVCASKFS